MRRRLAVTLLIALVAAPASAQTASSVTAAPLPGAPSLPPNPGQADRHFAHQVALGGMAEVAMGRLASQKARNPDGSVAGFRHTGRLSDNVDYWEGE